MFSEEVDYCCIATSRWLIKDQSDISLCMGYLCSRDVILYKNVDIWWNLVPDFWLWIVLQLIVAKFERKTRWVELRQRDVIQAIFLELDNGTNVQEAEEDLN